MRVFKNKYFVGLFKNAQIQGSRKPVTGAYMRVREDYVFSGKHRKWAFQRATQKYKIKTPQKPYDITT